MVGSWTKTGWELDVQNLGGANTSSVDMSNFAPSAWNLVSGVQRRRVYNDYAGTKVKTAIIDHLNTYYCRTTTLT